MHFEPLGQILQTRQTTDTYLYTSLQFEWLKFTHILKRPRKKLSLSLEYQEWCTNTFSRRLIRSKESTLGQNGKTENWFSGKSSYFFYSMGSKGNEHLAWRNNSHPRIGNKQNLILFMLQPNTRVISPHPNFFYPPIILLPFDLSIHCSPK